MDDDIQITHSNGTFKDDHDQHGNEQRKSTSVPTLMITVKNEMAQGMNEQPTTTNGKLNSAGEFRSIFFFSLKMPMNQPHFDIYLVMQRIS